ncbi:Iron-sulfur assembly protein IscA-like 2 [Abeliophyllum distichum]|uniref:Iron-sulfur assembly protein IscA-like 2 n=1 Tax=Abeliophyllum distichum TaxID=126358 RepID=A0ABD1V872_9LAMI
MTTSSQALFRRLTPYFSARLRQNYRLLSSAPALSTDLREPQPSSSSSESPSLDVVHLTANCVRRIKELQASETNGKLLRLSIEAGGCSGFQYNFLLDDKTNDDDRIFERDGVKLVVDNVSYDFVKGATIDYVEELIRSAFQFPRLCFHSTGKESGSMAMV